MKSIWLRLACFVISVTFAHSISLAAVLDQSFEPNANLLAFVNGNGYVAQTFTIMQSGNLLSIDLPLGEAPHFLDQNNPTPYSFNLIFDLRPTIDGVPEDDDSKILAKIIIPSSFFQNPEPWTKFDLQPYQIRVETNELLAFVLHSDANLSDDPTYGSVAVWPAQVNSGFLGSKAFYKTLKTEEYRWNPMIGDIPAVPSDPDSPYPSSNPATGPITFGFRSYVEPVPEPSTLIMLLAGTIGLFVYLKRNQSCF
jgi:hypothetical protein